MAPEPNGREGMSDCRNRLGAEISLFQFSFDLNPRESAEFVAEVEIRRTEQRPRPKPAPLLLIPAKPPPHRFGAEALSPKHEIAPMARRRCRLWTHSRKT